MKKLLAVVLMLAALSGCACHDGTKGSLFSNSTNYDPCGMGCVKKGKDCGCSKACPCWDKHAK